MAELRRNRVKHKLAEGEVATVISGTPTQITSDMIDFIGPLGFDGVWIEAEHGPVDFGDIADLTRACDLWGMTSVARVNLNLPGVIYRTLDQGAQAVVVPHVNTAEEAVAVVDATKFHPIGSRGIATSRQGIGVDDYIAKANDETMALVLIEDITAVTNLPEILKVDHIDVFFVAPGDLAQSMGYPGNPNHPDVNDMVASAIEQIVGAGRVAGALTDEFDIEKNYAMGARFLMTRLAVWVDAGSRAYLERVAAVSR